MDPRLSDILKYGHLILPCCYIFLNFFYKIQHSDGFVGNTINVRCP